MSSSAGSGMSGTWRRRSGEEERGFHKSCKWCGEAFVMRTSKTYDNPGRIFHCCPQDKNHLSKWTDKSVIEEVEDMKKLIEERTGNLELESDTCEAVVGSFGKNIEELSEVVVGFGKEMKEVKDLVNGYEKEVKSLKNMLLYGFGIMLLYSYFVM